MLTVACSKDDAGLFSAKHKLTKRAWKLESLVNTETNVLVETNHLYYRFESNGDYIVTCNDSVKYFSTWEFVNDGDYLRIGNNTFKIKIITNKLVGLQYGTVDIFYTPLDE